MLHRLGVLVAENTILLGDSVNRGNDSPSAILGTQAHRHGLIFHEKVGAFVNMRG